jgi:hypothetical protein
MLNIQKTLKSKQRGLGLMILALTALSAHAAGAHPPYERTETRTVADSNVYLEPGESVSLKLYAWEKVQKLYIQAEAANRRDTMVEVSTNGDTKGSLYLPARDPSYVVTVGEITSSIELRNTGRGAARIYSVKAETVVSPGYNYPVASSPWEMSAYNQASSIAARAINLVDALQPMTNYIDYGDYLLPIKKAAGRAYASAQARGPMSLTVRADLINLRAAIDNAAAYIDDAFERSAAFELSTELLSLREKLDSCLR